tara:strand:+ start:325 stop:462 length:138 start_codon:yes stop_codon:yes gene_type:complete
VQLEKLKEYNTINIILSFRLVRGELANEETKKTETNKNPIFASAE